MKKRSKGTNNNSRKVLITGNEACGEAAVRAGCQFYAGYPITPQNELTAYMSKRMREEGRVFIQAESELAAINMVFGASAAGRRAMTSSSSPGVSLKQEGISYIAGCELPCFIVNVMRGGPGLGNIAPSQGDYFQATRGGGHGDYRVIVLAPSSVQEMFDFTVKAFDLADIYRMPAMVLADGILGQMMEPIVMPDRVKPRKVAKPWALTGCKGRPPNVVRSLLLGPGRLEALNIRLQKKYAVIQKKECLFEEFMVRDAEIILVAYGLSSRIGRSIIRQAREEGIKAGLFRPITLWPFPYPGISGLAANKKRRFLVIEMSAGQMLEDVRLSVQDDKRVFFYGKMGGEIPTKKEGLKILKSIYGKKI